MAGGFGYDQPRHDLAWHYLKDEDPDIALLQEAVPPEWSKEHWRSVVWTPRQGEARETPERWGSAVVTRSLQLEAAELGSATPWLAELTGSVSVARTVEAEPLWLASIHSNAYPFSEERMSRLDKTSIRRCQPPGVYEIEVIAPELARLCGGESFICGGDLNAGLLFDTNYKKTSNQLLFDNLRETGLVDLRPRHSATEQQTYFKAGKGPYQLDHIFADEATEKRVQGWRVIPLPEVNGPPLSDHAPIEVTLERSKPTERSEFEQLKALMDEYVAEGSARYPLPDDDDLDEFGHPGDPFPEADD